jgi:hypothetical protein
MTDYLAVLAEAALGGGEHRVRPVRPPVFAYPLIGERRPQPVAGTWPNERPDGEEVAAAAGPPRREWARPPAADNRPAEVRPVPIFRDRPAPGDVAGDDGAVPGRADRFGRDEVMRPGAVTAPAAPSGPDTAIARPPARPDAGPAPQRSPAAAAGRPRVERVVEIVPARRPPAGPGPPPPGGPPPATETAPRVVHVSIGRIEIRAVHPPAPPAPRAPAEPPPARLSLDDYLHGREEAGRR